MQLLTMKRTVIPKGHWSFTFLIWPFLKLLSVLPFTVLFAISDVLRFVLYRLIGYRVKVVRRIWFALFLRNQTVNEDKLKGTFINTWAICL